MRADWSKIEAFRRSGGTFGTNPGDRFGAFYIPVGRASLICIVSDGNEEIPWEHVSLRAKDYKGERCPTWAEMAFAKDVFWEDEECVVQFHPPKSEYVNNHPFVLHLWRPTGKQIETPPSIAVGIK